MPSRTIIRAPNHLGDLVMALPALEAAGQADILVLRCLAPLLGLVRPVETIRALDRGGRGFLRAASTLRRAGYRDGVLLAPSFSSALLFAAGGVPRRRGIASDARRPLLTEPVPAREWSGVHRRDMYYRLVTGGLPDRPLVPRLAPARADSERWSELVGDGEPPIGICPGSNARSRRWPATRFRELTERLVKGGREVVVFGDPGQRALTAEVAGRFGRDLGGRTDLALLATGLARCRLLVTNDSGPMHLAAAVGTPTVSLWGPGDPTVTGPPAGGNLLLRHPELPCVPCVRHVCPRTGQGFVLREAHRECLGLIGVDDVIQVIEGIPAFTEP